MNSIAAIALCLALIADTFALFGKGPTKGEKQKKAEVEAMIQEALLKRAENPDAMDQEEADLPPTSPLRTELITQKELRKMMVLARYAYQVRKGKINKP